MGPYFDSTKKISDVVDRYHFNQHVKLLKILCFLSSPLAVHHSESAPWHNLWTEVCVWEGWGWGVMERYLKISTPFAVWYARFSALVKYWVILLLTHVPTIGNLNHGTCLTSYVSILPTFIVRLNLATEPACMTATAAALPCAQTCYQLSKPGINYSTVI